VLQLIPCQLETAPVEVACEMQAPAGAGWLGAAQRGGAAARVPGFSAMLMRAAGAGSEGQRSTMTAMGESGDGATESRLLPDADAEPSPEESGDTHGPAGMPGPGENLASAATGTGSDGPGGVLPPAAPNRNPVSASTAATASRATNAVPEGAQELQSAPAESHGSLPVGKRARNETEAPRETSRPTQPSSAKASSATQLTSATADATRGTTAVTTHPGVPALAAFPDTVAISGAASGSDASRESAATQAARSVALTGRRGNAPAASGRGLEQPSALTAGPVMPPVVPAGAQAASRKPAAGDDGRQQAIAGEPAGKPAEGKAPETEQPTAVPRGTPVWTGAVRAPIPSAAPAVAIHGDAETAHSGANASCPADAAGPVQPPASIAMATRAPAPEAHGSDGSAGAVLERMDSAAAPRVLASAPQRLAVGIRDNSLGWVEIRTHAAAGQIAAVLATGSGAAQAALHASLPEMRNFLAGQQVHVDQLSAEPFPASSGDRQGSGHAESPGKGTDDLVREEPLAGPSQAATDDDAEEALSFISVRV
jgi:hypothetical protein